ncbi:MAG: protein up-regulated by thyroid hormone-putative PQQ-dependent glucose dehydrogenase [Bacteroidetes bacterium]|jgi:glucose/arabinose dehydrogenase|nr:protein up-regulated by thyroid hormone-putative PQQ-dependent glucose dehydrogenase [Bacteroidota bacterium]
MARTLLLALMVLTCVSALVHSQPVTLVDAFPSLTFTKPVLLVSPPDGTDRVFVVQQNGIIRVFRNDSLATTSSVFLDISSRLSALGGEEGLLGLAFHPNFGANGLFFVNYTAPATAQKPFRTVIARYAVSPGTPDAAQPSSEAVILEVPQPYSNHNGGMIAFGPDGNLYIGMGDGGSADDPGDVAQNLTSLLGKMLRIDIRDSTAQRRYVIPSDNPFAGNTQGYREEIWAYGFRNPWRFSIDAPTGELWAGDVGQGAREEIDLVVRGGNYGWKIMEGSICRPPTTGCVTTGLILPVKDYGRSLGYSVTGGYVYRGQDRPGVTGAYIYGDYGSGRIWLLRRSGGTVVADSLLIDTPYAISGFGMDSRNELYILSYNRDVPTSIYRFSRAATTQANGAPENIPVRDILDQNYPNPFNPSTAIAYAVQEAGRVRLTVHDLLGREIALLVNDVRTAGRYTVTFDGSGRSSGVYFYRLVTDRGSITRSFVLAK